MMFSKSEYILHPNEVEMGYTGFTLSIRCPAVDRIMSVLYLPEY